MGKMVYKLHRSFKYRLRERADTKMRKLVAKRLRQFEKDPHNTELLDTHELDHAWEGFCSMDITPNWIAVYYEKPGKYYMFVTCGDKTRVLKPWNVRPPVPPSEYDWITIKNPRY